MRIESVTAHAFGPLADQTLTLAPGMTVVTGVNESAKSSWHAALYAAVCGRRRGKGAPKVDERRFIERHKPWDRADWRVSAVVVLDDGRRVEISQDLDGKVDCRAMDLDLARDISADVMFDGSPDASRFLGLDRKSFLATAVVNQADLLSVLDSADGLQEHLQRAASAAGHADATAAQALACLEKFFKDHVGQDRANSTKPLRAAKDRLAAAQQALLEAHSAHEQYTDLVAAADDLREAAALARADYTRAAAHASAVEQVLSAVQSLTAAAREAREAKDKLGVLVAELGQARRRLARVEQLHERFGGIEPAGVAAGDTLARQVAAALAAWEAAPPPRTLTGPSAEQLQAQLEALPAAPDGDLEVDPLVRSHLRAYERAQDLAVNHRQRRPAAADTPAPDPELAAALAAGPQVLRELAADLEAAPAAEVEDPHRLTARQAELDEAVATRDAREQEVGQARSARDRLRAQTPPVPAPPAAPARRPAGALLAGAGALVLLAAAAALLVAGQWPAGAASAVVAAVVAAAAAARMRATTAAAPGPVTGPASPAALQEADGALRKAEEDLHDAERAVAAAEGALQVAREQARRDESARAQLTDRTTALRVPADPARLRALAAAAEQHRAAADALATWETGQADLDAQVNEARTRLLTALSARGADTAGGSGEVDPVSVFADYERDCARRAAQAADAARAPELAHRLDERAAAEETLAQERQLRERAREQLVSAATAAGVDSAPDPAATVAALGQWQQARTEQVKAAEAEQQQWAELQTLLDGATLEQLRQQVQDMAAQHEQLMERAETAAQVYTEASDRHEKAALEAGLDPDLTRDPGAVEQVQSRAREAAEEARREQQRLAESAGEVHGQVLERERSLPPVAEAEEQVIAAAAELDRVLELAETLRLTQQLVASPGVV